MTSPNRSTLWGEVIVDELVAAGVDAACVSPGSRSTPLTVALADHPGVRIHSHLDERSGAFFALGRGRRTGRPTAFVCTSGTAAVNAHPAVVEASESHVPLVVLTADRPAELHGGGANQTIDQADLYGDAVRHAETLPEPAPEPRRLRSLRTSVGRAVATATGTPPGPVHLNVPLSKPLEPTPVEGDVPDALAEDAPRAVEGRDGPYVATVTGRPTLDETALDDLVATLETADRGLVVAGPANAPDGRREAIASFARATEWPILADPLSGLRFGPHVESTPVCAGYDSYLAAATEWPEPDVVLRFGASPTSKTLRKYLRDVDARQLVVDPAGEWPEAEFTATDLLVADPTRLAENLAEHVDADSDASGSPRAAADWRSRFERTEDTYWATVEPALADEPMEGSSVAATVEALPDPATLYLSNSMPVRDADRFARPRTADLTALGNRGASGVDGMVSSALGAASATDDPLVLVTGDLALYHDANGLLAVDRCDVDATIVVVNNDGGGIFHKLPIESFDPPFTEQFKTPHGLDFASLADLYGLEFERVVTPTDLSDVVASSVGSGTTNVIEVRHDAAASHRARESLHERACGRVREAVE